MKLDPHSRSWGGYGEHHDRARGGRGWGDNDTAGDGYGDGDGFGGGAGEGGGQRRRVSCWAPNSPALPACVGEE